MELRNKLRQNEDFRVQFFPCRSLIKTSNSSTLSACYSLRIGLQLGELDQNAITYLKLQGCNDLHPDDAEFNRWRKQAG